MRDNTHTTNHALDIDERILTMGITPTATNGTTADTQQRNAKDKAEQTMTTTRQQALEDAIAQIKRDFGRGAVMRLSETRQQSVSAVSTGSLSLDIAVGIGGLPRGRIVEIYGSESAGKSTLAMSTVAQAQKNGGACAYVDVEHAMDPEYAKAIGVDIDSLLISQPDSAEQALEIVEHLVRSGALDVIVLDSVAALVPMAEIEGDMGDSHPGAQARLMSQALRKLTGIIHKTNTVCIFINQIREQIGIVYGSPERQPGGRALKFYSSVRLDMRRREILKQGKEFTGNKVKVKVVKNKVAPPFQQVEIDIIFNEGISLEGDIIELGVEHGILDKRGAYYSFKETRLGQGREATRDFLKEHTDIRDQIENQIREIALPKPQEAAS